MSDALIELMRKIAKLGLSTMIVQRMSDEGEPIIFYRSYVNFTHKQIKYRVYGDDTKELTSLFRAISRLPPEIKSQIRE